MKKDKKKTMAQKDHLSLFNQVKNGESRFFNAQINLGVWSPSPDFIGGVAMVIGNKSYVSIARSDPKDSPNSINIEQFNIQSSEGKLWWFGPYKTMSWHPTSVLPNNMTSSSEENNQPTILISAG